MSRRNAGQGLLGASGDRRRRSSYGANSVQRKNTGLKSPLTTKPRKVAKEQDDSDGSRIGRRHRPDYIIVVCMSLLLAISLVVIYSVSPALGAQLSGGDVNANHFMYRQIFFLFLGVAAFVTANILPLSVWPKLQKYIIIAAVVSFFILLIPALSLSYGGATRWVQRGPINYQPAELLKFGLIFYLALFLAKASRTGELNGSTTLKKFMLIMGLIGLEVVILQKDLGTMIPIVAIMMTMLYLSGVGLKRIAAITGIILIAGVMAISLAGHRRARVFTFLNPSADASGSGYHINQALIAVGSGGIFGKGLGGSIQAFGYLPEAANDSIFAIMSEKFGFAGITLILFIYGVLLFRIIRVVARAPNIYLSLVAAGVFAWMMIQALVNIGAMLSIMPLTGVTLPLLSFGGTSLILTLTALGVVFHISRYTKLGHIETGGDNARYTSGRRFGRSRLAA